MTIKVTFEESKHSFEPEFGEVHNVSDGGYERGYEDGYKSGTIYGYEKGHEDGVDQGYVEGYSAGSGVAKAIIDGSAEEISTNATTIREYAFCRSRSLRSADLPYVETIGNNAFQDTAISSINVPNVTTINNNAFQGAGSLKTIEFKSNVTFGSAVFYGCNNLTKLILLADAVCVCKGDIFLYCAHYKGTTSAYNPEGLKDGYIFVQDDLVEQYREAQHWSLYAEQIKPLSELDSN